MTTNALSTGTAMAEDPSRQVAASSDFEDFIYLISHDVRSSVRALIELPQWIEEDLAEAGVRMDGSIGESIELMNRHTGRLDRMLVDLLAFSRVGRMQSVVEVDLAAALDDVLDELPIPAGFKIKRTLEHARFRFGERDLLTLLTVLVSNGIKHHNKISGEIVVSSRKEGSDVVLTVADDGPGIAPEFEDRIFGAMTTLRPRDEVEGSGMGLAIARKIVRLHGGDIQVAASEADSGTVFEARWPA
ncbi:hypothetical protein So717_39110 [Roseobacter cerasinus]|uniref:histidine kinase n=1 Tax=Roseobacter cerasinus TaxID=2602289 RepID=A0A640VUR6_9RHOB|nr:HAMP domain-containing sensor histidine kinase [Roseobacter cerasinus]GFE52158.1 hypothetical protein So717_39110 [Roseobacter cerasinus]